MIAAGGFTITKLLVAGVVFLQVCLGLLLLLWLLSLIWNPAKILLGDVQDLLRGKELWVAWGLALIATLGSLYFSEIRHFVPCRLCWFQRIGMYPMTVILLVGALRKDGRAAVQYALAFPIFGAIVSLYHLYIEAHPGAESASCKVGVACSVKWINELGYLTIPMLALTVFVSIFAVLLFALQRPAAQSPNADVADRSPEN